MTNSQVNKIYIFFILPSTTNFRLFQSFKLQYTSLLIDKIEVDSMEEEEKKLPFDQFPFNVIHNKFFDLHCLMKKGNEIVSSSKTEILLYSITPLFLHQTKVKLRHKIVHCLLLIVIFSNQCFVFLFLCVKVNGLCSLSSLCGTLVL